MVQLGFAPLTTDPTVAVKCASAGMAACIGDIITFPLDTAKVRLQIQGEGTVAAGANSFKYRGIFGTLLTISRQEGPRALYGGLAAGLQRQMCFASVRIGLYDEVKKKYQTLFSSNGGHDVGIRILAGITTGGMAVSCAQPTDVVKVRMQAQGSTGVIRYTGCLHAYRTIARTEGIRGLWKGTLPNICRNSIVNATELVAYDLIKEQILRYNLMSDNMPCHFVAAFASGFCTTVTASPVDVVKTRYMNSNPGVYNGAFHCARTMFKERGLMAFYKGFMPSFLRLGSWNICMFVSYEQLKRAITHYSSNIDLPSYMSQPVVAAAPRASLQAQDKSKSLKRKAPKKVFDHISDKYFIDPY